MRESVCPHNGVQPPTERTGGGSRWVLSELALEGVATYRYVSGSSTFLDRVLNHFWNWAVQWLPLWVAPNLVTLLGLAFMLASAALIVVVDKSLTAPMSPQVAVFCAFSLFAYQTLDAIDGKQARRTGTSSPLGELFDHGCDALNAVFIFTVLAATWRLGDHPWLMLTVLFNIFFAFFMGQWEEYHTGLMMTNNGYIGVTEGQIVQIIILLVTATFGASFWDKPVLRLGVHEGAMVVTVKAVGLTWGCLLTLWVSLGSLYRVLLSGQARSLPVGEVGNKVLGRREAVRQLLPVLLSFLLGAMWTVGHGQHVFLEHPVGVLLALGLTMAYLSTRMIVSHMAKQPFGSAELILPVLPQVLVLANTHCRLLSEPISALGAQWGGQSLPLPDVVVMWLYVALITVAYAYFSVGATEDICAYLGLHCLSIHPRMKAA
ncbi:cdp-ethanolamine:dag ethanolamine phosphotransferase [Nannochloropsis gaditana]|uniref:Cdp-ethanolamine:dag ethanolamine phosphotransferase n=1 Tax=Nannochloropsis gaditana TaxID=72520 RepID=W7TNP7_9STRA|nr:cdp-ethanolamine:dag ethanolamine phosphotransferase [Nannochloropsis gaditana]